MTLVKEMHSVRQTRDYFIFLQYIFIALLPEKAVQL